MIKNIFDKNNQYNRIKKSSSLKEIEKELKPKIFEDIPLQFQNYSDSIKSKEKQYKIENEKDTINLLHYSLLEDAFTNAKNPLSILYRLKKEKPKPKKSKVAYTFLFKGNFNLIDKIKKTKILEFNFSKPIKRNKNKTSINLKKKTEHNLKNKSQIFITNVCNGLNNTQKNFNRNNLKKIDKTVKKSNSCMVNIYNGLYNIRENKLSSDDIISYDSYFIHKRVHSNSKMKNKTLSNFNPSTQNYKAIKKKFSKLFKGIMKNDIYNNKPINPKNYIAIKESIPRGLYVKKSFNNINNYRKKENVWIKPSTSNLLILGDAFNSISDEKFYKERKIYLGLNLKVEKDAGIATYYKKIDKRNPLLKKMKHNLKKINHILEDEYNLMKKVNEKFYYKDINYER